MSKRSTNLLSDKLIMIMGKVKTALDLPSTWDFQSNSTLEALAEDRLKPVTNIGKYVFAIKILIY